MSNTTNEPTNKTEENGIPESQMILVETGDFKKMIDDFNTFSSMIQYLVSRGRAYERLLHFLAAYHHEPLIVLSDTDMMQDLVNQYNAIAERWNQMQFIAL